MSLVVIFSILAVTFIAAPIASAIERRRLHAPTSRHAR